MTNDYKLEKINIKCPCCGSRDYMFKIIGMSETEWNVKCTNCNVYFVEADVKPQTNADRIRAMSDEELADLLTTVNHVMYMPQRWLDWLKQEEEQT